MFSNCTEAYEIIDGKIGSPIKGATLIGDGPSILKKFNGGNDMMLDPGIGTCGKAGQGVPVGVAQPSILINKNDSGRYKTLMIKDQEYLSDKASYCLDLAKRLGATDSNVVVSNSISETVNFRNQKLDESNRSDDLAISITTYIGKRKSSISSSNLLKENLDILMEKCIETTKNTPEDEFNSLPDKDLLATELKDLNLYDDTHITNENKIEYLKRLEASASNNKKIINTESSFAEDKSNFYSS